MKMMRVSKKIFVLLALTVSLVLQGFVFSESNLPVSGENPGLGIAYDGLPLAQPVSFDTLQDVGQPQFQASKTIPVNDFVQTLVDGNADTIRGLYVDNKFAFPVVQQPSGNAGFVSTTEDVLTDFAMPRKYGVTGMLAHNYLAGNEFFALEIGDLIQVVYGDGSIQMYQISDIQSYQALSPNSGNSNFIDLATSEKLTATQLFKRVYMGEHHLTLQTCIQQGSEDSWGRLFIIANPV
jgi:hypothetical protein